MTSVQVRSTQHTDKLKHKSKIFKHMGNRALGHTDTLKHTARRLETQWGSVKTHGQKPITHGAIGGQWAMKHINTGFTQTEQLKKHTNRAFKHIGKSLKHMGSGGSGQLYILIEAWNTERSLRNILTRLQIHGQDFLTHWEKLRTHWKVLEHTGTNLNIWAIAGQWAMKHILIQASNTERSLLNKLTKLKTHEQ